jgi:hypothetical protein
MSHTLRIIACGRRTAPNLFNIAHTPEEHLHMATIFSVGKATRFKRPWMLDVTSTVIAQKEKFMPKDLKSTALVLFLNKLVREWMDVSSHFPTTSPPTTD